MAKIIYAPGTSTPGTVARAKALDGDPCRIGYCLYEQLVRIFKVPGLGDYDHDGDADCLDYWKAAKKRGEVVETTDPKGIPVGALVIWSGGYGHAAFCIAPGKVLGTDLPTRGRFGIVDIDVVRQRWGKKLLGYVVVDGNGFTLMRALPKPPPKPKPTYYVVVPEIGINARSAPSTKSKVIRTVRKGTKIPSTKIVVAQGRHWAVDTLSKPSRYYALEHLRRV